MSLRFSNEARAEVIQSARYYEAQHRGSGERFLAAAYAAAFTAEQHPLRGRKDVEGFFRIGVKKHPYYLVYSVESLSPLSILIVAVSHHRRLPGYWLDRIH